MIRSITVALAISLCVTPASVAQSVDERLAGAMRLADSIEAQVGMIEKRADALTVWFGFPDDAVRARADERARAVLRLCDRASEGIASAVEASDRDESGDEGVRDTLIEANAGRIPLREARAHLLLASTAEETRQRDAHVRDAREAMAEIRGTSSWIEREAALLDAVATMLEGNHGRAGEKFNALRLDLQENEGASARLEFTPPVTLGLLVSTLEADGWSRARTAARTLLEKAPFVIAGDRDPALALISSDVRARIASARARDEVISTEREKRLDEAFAHYEEFARLLIERGTDAREAWALTCDEARDAIRDWMDDGRLPPVAQCGLARALSDTDSASERAVELARDALRDVEEGPLRDVIAWTLVTSLLNSEHQEDMRQACELATSIARRYPDDMNALRVSSEIALNMLGAREDASVEIALAALRLAHERGGAGRIGAYRLALGRSLIGRGGEANLREAIRVLETTGASGELSEMAAIESARASGALFRETGLDDDARLWLARARRAASMTTGEGRMFAEAGVIEALLAMDRADDALARARDAWNASSFTGENDAQLQLGRRVIEASRRAGDLSLIPLVLDSLSSSENGLNSVVRLSYEAAAQHVESVGTLFLADAGGAPLPDAIDVLTRVSRRPARAVDASLRDASDERLATALLMSGEALRALETVEALRERSIETADRLRIAAEAKIALGDDAGAFAELRRLAQATSERTGESEYYWYAWARMLEILERQNERGARTEAIRREITRLRATDGFGLCAECAERIERVAEAVGMV